MTDPFRALRGPDSRVAPDESFSADLMARVDERLDATLTLSRRAAPTQHAELEVVAMKTTKHARTRWPLAVAAVAVVGVVAVAILSRNDQPASTDGATTVPLGPAGNVAVATALQGRWMSGPRPLLGDGPGVSLRLTDDTFALGVSNEGDISDFSGGASLAADGALTLASTRPPCDSAAPGTYRVTLSPSGRALTLTAISEPCQSRRAAISGTYWRAACRNPDTFCLGDLDAGTYSSQYIRPLLGPEATWSPLFGGVTYTVPQGWANYSDFPPHFGLAPRASFAATTPGNLEPTDAIQVFAHPTAASNDPQCTATAGPPVDNAADLLAQVKATPGLNVSQPTAVTVDGRTGVSVDLTADAGTMVKCPDAPVAEYLLADDFGQAIGADETQRLILLDVGTASSPKVLAIVITATSPAGFDTFAASAMPIILSMHFH